MDWALWLLLAATIVNALLVGASLDQERRADAGSPCAGKMTRRV
jgi:hypothetical protein